MERRGHSSILDIWVKCKRSHITRWVVYFKKDDNVIVISLHYKILITPQTLSITNCIKFILLLLKYILCFSHSYEKSNNMDGLIVLQSTNNTFVIIPTRTCSSTSPGLVIILYSIRHFNNHNCVVHFCIRTLIQSISAYNTRIAWCVILVEQKLLI